MRSDSVVAVLRRLGVDRPAPSLLGLRAVYAAWCGAVSFDNVLKMIHVGEGRPGPLPGSTADGFFDVWLEHGVGGTCWAGNGALHDLLEALGFDVVRAIATMLTSPETRGPNHGSVIVSVEGERWIVDASILSGEPIRILGPGRAAAVGRLSRFEWLDDHPAVIWRMLSAPDGFPCRIDRIGADAREWDTLHQRTGDWSPFNYQLSARVLRGTTSLGLSSGQRYTIDRDGLVVASDLDQDGRVGFLVDELGMSEEIARRVPDDGPIPPRPES